MKNIDNEKLEICSLNPITGYHRDGYCSNNENDTGKHLVCAKMNKNFMDFTKKKGNNLYSVVKPKENWCLCEERWLEAYKNGKAPIVIKKATNFDVKSNIKKKIFLNNRSKKINKQNGGKKKSKSKQKRRNAIDHKNKTHKKKKKFLKNMGKTRKKRKRKNKTKRQFLYNPNNPKKSFDVYIDKNPKDTIPIKYTTVDDVKSTIKKLERLFKTKQYTHKRIWQVGMIMKVRLEAMLKHKKSKYPNAKYVKQRFNLANKYFKFLGERTKKKSFMERKKMSFKID